MLVPWQSLILGLSSRQAKATGKPYTLADTDGLSLFVSASGAKAWHFRFTWGGKRERIADAAAFAGRYNDIVTPAIKRVVANQRYGALFVEQQGVMLGRGEVWLNGTCRDGAACRDVDVRVVAIQPVVE